MIYMGQARTKKSICNMFMALIYNVVTIVLGFYVRKLFLDSLGVTILGYNSTFSSILGMLNLAELGIGMAVTYKLYEPIVRQDYNIIVAYVDIYKKLYYGVGAFILFAGLLIIPFLPIIVKEGYDNWMYLSSIYVLQLLATVVTYWFSYKRIVFSVYQDNYITSIIDSAVFVIIFLLQVTVLFCLCNYYIYLCLSIIKVILSNVIVSVVCEKKYSHLKLKCKNRSVKFALKDLKKDIMNVLVARLGAYVLNSTDALVISTIMGAVATGYMTNYSIIFTSFQSMILFMLVTIQPSLGNKIICEKERHVVEKVIFKCTYFTLFITSMFCIPAFFLIDHFIVLWLSEDFVLNHTIAFLFSFNVYLAIMSNPINLLFGALGYYKYDKYIVGISAILNITLSIIMVFQWGIVGVLLGTTIAWLLYWISRVFILYKKYYQFSVIGYFKWIVRCIGATMISAIIVFLLDLKLSAMEVTWGTFVLKGFLFVMLIFFVDIIVFLKTDELRYGVSVINKLIKR